MIYTTLKQLRTAGACVEGYNKLVCSISGGKYSAKRETYVRFKHDADIDLLHVVKSNGLDDVLWALRASNATDRDCRLFAVWCARQVDQNEICTNTLFVAERYANGNATNEELDAARDAARYAAMDAARYAARYAAMDSAMDSAWAAAWAAARYAAMDAARYAARYAAMDAARYAARYAAMDSAMDAAMDAARAAQKEMFIKMCNGEAPWQKGE